MCGINGLFMLGADLPKDANELIAKMNSAIKHRGPDDSGIWINNDDGVAFGQQRLSILDLSRAGHQPMLNEYNDSIVFNGEIYNYQEIKNKITDYNFKTGTDTEVLQYLYHNSGHNCLSLLNGMFALAYFDNKNKLLKIARDRAGKKPLYYTIKNNIFAFSSEIKALLTLPWVNTEVDNESLYDFLTFNQLDAPQTMFKGINKLSPGMCMTINSSGKIDTSEYYEINYTKIFTESQNEIENNLFNLLNDSVKLRMIADVPVGAFLSGGVDSSAVVALMRKHSRGSISTFSIGFEGQPNYDERIYAEKVSKLFNTNHFEKNVSKKDIIDFVPDIVNIFDEPLADATCIPIYFISQLAHQNNIKVVQTGDGADEIFAGYSGWSKYRKLYPYFNLLQLVPKGFKSFLKNSLSESKAEFVKDILSKSINQQELFWGGAKGFKEAEKYKYLNKIWIKENENFSSYSVIEKHKIAFEKIKNKNSWLKDEDWMCYLGYKYIIPSLYLSRMDKISMSQSIETRNPFLDFRIVDYGLSIPHNLKIKNNTPKFILKKSLEQILPKEILYRKKMGFCVPLREWAEEIMVQSIENEIDSFTKKTDIFEKEKIKELIIGIKQGNKAYTNKLWTVYFLINWHKKWM